MLDALLRTIGPDRFAAEYGSVQSVDGQLVCDFNNLGTYRIHAGGFVYVGPGMSMMPTANIIDMKAMLRKVTDGSSSWNTIYKESVGAIVKKFSALIPSNFKTTNVVDLIGDQALRRRRLLNMFCCSPTSPASLPGPVSILLTRHFGESSLNDYVVYIPKRSMHELSSRCTAVLGKKIKLHNEDALVVPYYAWTSDIVALELHYVSNKVSVVWLGDKKVGYSAISRMSDTDSVVETSVECAAKDQASSMSSGLSYTTALLNKSGNSKSWVPRHLYFVCRDPSTQNLIYPASIEKLGCKVSITTTPFIGNTDCSIDMQYAAVGSIVESIRKDKYISPDVLALMSSVSGVDNVRDKVIEELNELGEYSLLESFKSATRGGAIWATASGKMYSTDAGYLWEDDKNIDMNGELVTNYLIEPILSMSYETGELYRRMKVSIGYDSRVVDVPSGALDTPKKLTETINDVISLSGKPTTVTAAVYDQTRARAVVLWATKIFSELPVHKGTSYLGWSPTSTKYVTPSFTLQKVGEDVIETKGVFLRPGVDYFKYFAGDVEDVSIPDFSFKEGPIVNLVYQVAAIILRTYSGHPSTPVEYSGDKETRDTISEIFSSIAQCGLLQLNKNMRAASQLDALYGWPYAAQGYNRSQAKACESAMILLGEEGQSIKADANEIGKAKKALAWIVREVPTYLMKNSGPSFLPDAEQIDSVALSDEGRSIIKEVLTNKGIDTDLPVTSYNTTKVVL